MEALRLHAAWRYSTPLAKKGKKGKKGKR